MATSRFPTLVLNVTHPLVPEEISGFCAGKRAVLIVEEGAPDFIEQAIGQILRKADLNTQAARQRPARRWPASTRRS